MSFRRRLLIAFAALALLQAGLFTLLSDQLVRDGIEGEADARLALLGSLFPRELSERDWPRRVGARDGAWKARMAGELRDYASSYGVDRAALLQADGTVLDSRDGVSSLRAADWWLADSLQEPAVQGRARVSGPLFHSEDGWHKVLYLKFGDQGGDWLRLEAGTPFLGQVAAIQKRLFRLALALVLPSLLVGWLLALALSRRAEALAKALEGSPKRVALEGKDEFARLASSVDALLVSLERERSSREALLEDRLSQARHLAFGVAHELRNPLAGMSLTMDLLARRAEEGAPQDQLKPLWDRARAEAERLEVTVARFLEFARTPDLCPAPLDLGPCASLASKGLSPAPRIEGQAKAMADPKAVEVALSILLTNACESAGGAGEVRVRMDFVDGFARASVWDSGAPIPEGERARLFTPFHTTKPKGMGLGLATAAGLALAMGGRLALAADGKTFELSLPTP